MMMSSSTNTSTPSSPTTDSGSSSSSGGGSSSSSSNIVQRVSQLMQQGDYYDAQQLIKSLYHKQCKLKKFTACIPLLITGIKNMLKYEQGPLAMELSRCVLEVLQNMDKNAELGDDLRRPDQFPITKTTSMSAIELLSTIICAFPNQHRDLKMTLLNESIKFTQQKLKKQDGSGDPALHYLLAKELWAAGSPNNFHDAHLQFSRSGEEHVSEHSQLLYEWSQQGDLDERDLFICRAVLHLLSRSRKDYAKRLYELYMQRHCKGKSTEEFANKGTPLTHFIQFLFTAIETKNHSLYQHLLKTYAPALDRDPSLQRFLDPLPQVYFGVVKRPQQQAGGGLEGMLSSLLGRFMAAPSRPSAASSSSRPPRDSGAM